MSILREKVQLDVKKVIGEYLKTDNLSLVETESRLVDDLGADSLDLIDVAFEIEEHFKITLSDLDIEKANTVEDYINMVYKELTHG